MWDSTPFVHALLATVHPSVRDAPEILTFIDQAIFREGERRPEFAPRVAAELVSHPMGFVYDRPTGLIFSGGYADHERCAGALMRMRELRAPIVDWADATFKAGLHDGKASDRYIEGGYGFVANSPQLTASSGVWPLNVGTEVILTTEEKIWFRQLEIRR